MKTDTPTTTITPTDGNPADMMAVMQLLQFSDSAFPVGTFSFSNGLETAAFEKIVFDRDTLFQFARSQAWQAAFTDGVAALHTHRAALRGDLEAVMEADRELLLCKMNDEARLMLTRMGKKLAELAVKIYPDDHLMSAWLKAITDGDTPGLYPVAQGLIFARAGIGERDLFCSHQYGVVNMVCSAALRCVRVSHYDTQLILFRLSEETPGLYEKVSDLSLDEMNAFFPELDVLASLHEKGNQRMFMS